MVCGTHASGLLHFGTAMRQSGLSSSRSATLEQIEQMEKEFQESAGCI